MLIVVTHGAFEETLELDQESIAGKENIITGVTLSKTKRNLNGGILFFELSVLVN